MLKNVFSKNRVLLQQITLLILVWSTSFLSIIEAQTPYLKHFSVEDGLPSSNVYTSYQDSMGLIWFGTDKGITRFNGYDFETFNMNNINASTDIWGIENDIYGRLWFSSQRQLTYLENNVFKAIPFPKSKNTNTVDKQYIDDKGNHYIQFQSALEIHKVDLENKVLTPLPQFNLTSSIHKVFPLKETDNGKQWFFKAIDGELTLLYVKENVITEIKKVKTNINFPKQYPIQISPNIFVLLKQNTLVKIDVEKQIISIEKTPFGDDFSITRVRRITNNLILLDTDKGYKVINKQFEIQENLSFINQFLLNDLFEDKHGNIWICTRNDGLYFLPKSSRASQTLITPGNLIKSDITALALDKKGRLWFTNKNLDLSVLKPDGHVHNITFNIQNPVKVNTYFDELVFDQDGNLIIGSNEALLIVIPQESIDDLLQKKSIYFMTEKVNFRKNDYRITLTNYNKPFFLEINVTKSINPIKNQIFITSSSCTYQMELNDKTLEIRKLNIGRAYSSAIWKDLLWIGRKDQLSTLDINNNETEDKPFDLFSYPINTLKVSLNDKLWIATDGNGLFRFDGYKTDTIIQFLDTRITIKSIFIDNKNQLWLSTNKGLGIIKILTEKPKFSYHFRMITKAFGLASDEVNSIIVNQDKIYVATAKGLTILNQQKIKPDHQKVPLFFTIFLINGESKDLKSNTPFQYNENNIRLEYLCLSYSNMGNIEYEYFMEGIDNTWQKTTATFKDYPTLPPGEYVFKIRARNLDGEITNEESLKITINLPWWKTWPAILFAILISFIIGYMTFRYQLKREKERNEKRRLEELTQLKTRFYANITHEFRTPLTLIMGLTQQLKKEASPSKSVVYEIIERHSNRLLNLINQLLDLNKLEAKAMPINYQNGDIITFIKYVVGLFEPAAATKKIDLILNKDIEYLTMDFDVDKIQSILFNLLSNAIKFTESNGKIVVQLNTIPTTNELRIKVQDTGVGISADAQAFIFNRFYQDNNQPQKGNTTGIGLALVKELIEQMNGNISVKSGSDGTTFIIYLPILQNQQKSKQIINEEMKDMIEAHFPSKIIELPNSVSQNDEEKPLLLLVEDDADLRAYLKTVIGNYYNIEVAKDGLEGIEKAIEHVPDLIISDVMMPNKNGFELCETLKNDERTSHIPIILLTSKSAKKDELQGLKMGADVYMIKPFHQEELIIRIKRLLDNQQKLQQRYQSIELPPVTVIATVQKEDEFILKVRTVIEKHIDDFELDVNFLCGKLHISRAQLHKKITFLTGNSITKFIRKIRLDKAEKLLRETQLNITEIAYEVGFDAKYFSKVFAKTYGVSPTKYRKALKEES